VKVFSSVDVAIVDFVEYFALEQFLGAVPL
jgi:hypothetical protein